MPILSDSEGACSDFEVISSTQRRVQSGNQGDNNKTGSLSNSTISDTFEEINQLASRLTDDLSSSICSACTISASSSLASSLISEGTLTNHLEDSEPWDDEVRKNRSNSLMHSRRERRDTERRRKRSENERAEKQPGGITSQKVLFALGTLTCSCVIAFSIYLSSNTKTVEDLKKLQDELDEIKYINKMLMSSLRKEEKLNAELLSSGEKRKISLEKENKKLKSTLESKEKELRSSKNVLDALKTLVKEDLPDRYGFDLSFKRCYENILPHEKLCRAIADGLKFGKYDSIFE